jgi:acyl-CoA dehydrogenase
LRDVQLIPGLEGSTHINLGQTAQFTARYFEKSAADVKRPDLLVAGGGTSAENPYLFRARTGSLKDVTFGHFLAAHAPLKSVPNVATFMRQVKAFARFVRAGGDGRDPGDTLAAVAIGHCLATIAYAQLIAEHATLLDVPRGLVSSIFCTLINDLAAAAVRLVPLPKLAPPDDRLLRRILAATAAAIVNWDYPAEQMRASFVPPSNVAPGGP